MALVLDHVGRFKRNNHNKIDINLTVKVKRKNSVVEDVGLLDEFKRLVETDLPDFDKKFIMMPASFTFDLAKLNKIEGFPEKAREMVEKQKTQGSRNIRGLDKWAESAQADLAEDQCIKATERAFRNSAGLLWSGFKKEKLFMVVRRSLGFSGNQGGLANTSQFTPLEIKFYEMIGIDVNTLSQDVTTFVNQLFVNPTLINLSEKDLIANLTSALKIIKPAYAEANIDAQKKYRPKLEKCIKDTYKAYPIKTLNRDQIQASLTRHLLTYLDRKDEFDSVLIDRNSSTIIHKEVKSWPQNGDMDSPGLESNLEKANMQLGKWKDLFNDVLGPSADMSKSWTSIGIIVLPNVPSRKKLEDRGVDAASLKYILTKEEMQDHESKWKQELQLGSNYCSEEEYKRIVAIIFGSHYVCFQSQSYNKMAEMEIAVNETVCRISGPSYQVMGLGGWSGSIDQSPGDVMGLKGKELGHVWNILFWNEAQNSILESLHPGSAAKNLVLVGDFGGGKTSTLVEGAIQSAQGGDTTYFFSALDSGFHSDKVEKIYCGLFILAFSGYGAKEIGLIEKSTYWMCFAVLAVFVWISWPMPWLNLGKKEFGGEGIMDVALEERFSGTGVEVITPRIMQKELNKLQEDNVLTLIIDFLKKKENHGNIKFQVFLDEVHVPKEDLKKIRKGKKSEIVKTLEYVQQYSSLAWASLSTSDLLEKQSQSLNEILVEIVSFPFKCVSYFLTWIVPACVADTVSSFAICSVLDTGLNTTVTVDTLSSHLSLYSPSYNLVQLGRCMRNSGSIADAASPEAVDSYNTANTNPKASVLSQGKVSTVPGPRPLCVLTKWSGLAKADYSAIFRSLQHCLNSLLPPSLLKGHIAVLCGRNISPGKVADLLSSYSPTLYDGGVEKYNIGEHPILLNNEQRRGQRQELKAWLTGGGGILVTHTKMYAGMECPVVILVTQNAGNEPGIRSGLLRAAACLVLITDKDMVKEEEIKKNLNVTTI